MLSRLNQLNDAQTKARTMRVQKESLYNQVKSISSGTAPDAIPIIAQNPTVQDRKSKLSDLQREKVRLLERYGERHPQVVNINASLADAQRQSATSTRPRCSKSRPSRKTSRAPRAKQPS